MTNQLRIIGGSLRGRKISFLDLPEIRPTPDRIRETLFNWLQTKIVGSVCLDLFCGSGALGLEAISRGAIKVFAYDKENRIVQHLKKIANDLKLDNYEVETKSIPFNNTIKQCEIDIIFLDPPFRKQLVMPCLDWIYQNKYLKESGLIYLETEKELVFEPSLNWTILKEKQAGQVCYRLLSMVNSTVK